MHAVVPRSSSCSDDSGSLTMNVAPWPSPRLLAWIDAAVQLDQLLGDRQPEPEPAVAPAASSCPSARSARTRAAGSWRDADAGVAHAELDVRVHALQEHLDRAALRRELDRRWSAGSRRPAAAGRDRRRRSRRAGRGCSPAARPWPAPRARRTRSRPCTISSSDTCCTSSRNLPGHDAAQVEQVVDELRLRARVALDDFDAALQLRRLRASARMRSSCVQPRMAFSGVRSSCESVARNSSFMRAARCAAMRALRSASSISSRCAPLASSASARLRSVRSRVTLAKPRSRPVVVAQRGDDDVGPEARAVLAHAPAFVLEAALRRARPAARARASRSRRPPADRTARSAGR